jgi:hypothetical protein
MAVITFKPKQITKRLVSVLGDRPRFVVEHRFGLSPAAERRTLEAIGGEYGITRERVRQIENFALSSIRRSEVMSKDKAAFDELRQVLESLGGVVAERELLEHVSKDPVTQNHVHLLLVIGDEFFKQKENKEFVHRWTTNEAISSVVEESLKNLHKDLSRHDIVPESEIISNFLRHLSGLPDNYKQEEVLRRWLNLSRKIGRNPLGDWGLASSSNINARGIRDFAFLVIRRHGSPMHFTEVSNAIEEVFGRKAHVATCHNELIKDNRFVLVGRGLYALKEWGYESGVVKDVIRNILKLEGPMTRDEIINRVLKERYVKENTIAVNLQDQSEFMKGPDGRYRAARA